MCKLSRVAAFGNRLVAALIKAAGAFLACSLVFTALLLPQTAAAQAMELWAYVDEKGMAHFANRRVDARYELYFQGVDLRGGGSGAGSGAAALGVGMGSGSAASSVAGSASAGKSTQPVQPMQPSQPNDAQRQRVQKLVTFFEISPDFKAVKHLLRDAAKKHNLDFELLQALIAIESRYNADAVSPKGAVGLMQIIPATGLRYGVFSDGSQTVSQKLKDPKTNIAAGSTYLKDLLKLFNGRTDLALAGYNAGEGAVQRAGNQIPNYPETQNYVATVMALYQALRPAALLARSAGGAVAGGFNADGSPRRISATFDPAPSPVPNANSNSGTSTSPQIDGIKGRGNLPK